MENRQDRGNTPGVKKELIRCPVCEDYFTAGEGFSCPSCRRGPLCKKHRLYGRKECVSCTVDLRLQELRSLREQVQNIGHFIRFLQFIVLVIGVYFTAFKYRLLKEIDLAFLEKNVLAQNLVPVGAGVLVLLGIFYFVLLSQKQKVGEIESEIEGIKSGRR